MNPIVHNEMKPSAKTTSKRARRSDGDATRARILESAGDLFAKHGFAETTSKTVAAAAQVDLASINYHFGSRDGLYQAVLIEAHRRFISLADLQAIGEAKRPAEEKLRSLIEALVGKRSSTTPWSVRVLLRELSAPSSHIIVLVDNEVRPKLSVILSILSEITGIPVGQPALFYCFVSVAAPCAVLVLSGNHVAPIAEGVATDDASVLAAHLHGFAMGGLKAAGQAYETGKARLR